MKIISIGCVLLNACFCFMVCSIAKADTETRFEYYFTSDEHFNVGFAGYPAEKEDVYQLEFEQNSLVPFNLSEVRRRCLKISGMNYRDDLFMYAYTAIENLQPHTKYQLNFSLEFASNMPMNEVRGGPGASVMMKIGAINHEPERFLDEHGFYRLNFDKGTQAQDGKDMIVLGDIAVKTNQEAYQFKTLNNQTSRFNVTSNAQGKIWIIVGTDSGFAGKTSLYYTKLNLKLD